MLRSGSYPTQAILILHWHASNELRSFQINESFFDISAEMEKRYDRAAKICPRKPAACTGLDTDQVNILIVGDSLTVDVVNILAPLYPDYRLVLSDLGGCPPAPDIVSPVGEPALMIEPPLPLSIISRTPCLLVR